MTARPKRFAYLLEVNEDETLVGIVIDSTGAELGRVDGYTESEVQASLRNKPGFDTWIVDPASDPRIAAAWARRDRRSADAAPTETAPSDPAPKVPGTEPRGATQARRAETHLCQFCGHEPMCIVAESVRKLAALLPIVDGCQGFDPPPPQDAFEFGDDLASLAGEPPEPSGG